MRHSHARPVHLHELQDDPLTKGHIFLLGIAIVIPNIVMVVTFSAMFGGLENLNKTATRSLQGDFLLFCCFCTLSLWVILDWQTWGYKLKSVTGAFPLCLFYAGAVCKAMKYPWAPMLATLLFMPALLAFVRYKFCHRVTRHKFYGAIAGLTTYTSLLIAVMWGYYVYMPPSNRWNQESKDALAAQVPDVYATIWTVRPLEYGVDCGNGRNTTMLNELLNEEKAAIRKACSAAATLWFLSWMCPFVAICCNGVVAGFCHLVGHIGKKGDISNLQRILTKFVLLIAFCLTGMYGSTTVLSSSSLRLGNTLLAFFMSAMAMLIMWLLNEIDLKQVLHDVEHNILMQQLVSIAHSDWIKAMGIGSLAVPFAYFLLLTYLTQAARKQRGVLMQLGGDPNDKFTPIGRKCIEEIRSWNWSSIMLKIIVLGEAFFTLQVGVMKVTYIFLSFLNQSLKDTPLEIVCALVFAIGSAMFLLPPVPGLPVYVFSGILLGEKGYQNPDIGFWGGIIIASFLSLATKLFACVGQYMIGYTAGKNVKVQQLIGVDKVPTRAIEKVLKARGLNLGKVALLVGGPDWPTSVTCGIIGVSIPQMLLGTLPVVSLTIPCILAGACMGRVTPGEESTWSLASNAATGGAAMVNMVAMVYAVFTVSKTIQNYGDELGKPRPEHAAVEALTLSEAEGNAYVLRTREWHNLHCFWKSWLVIATTGMYFSNVVFVSLAERCFKPFALSSKINDSYEDGGLSPLPLSYKKGHVLNIVVYPVGHFALFIFSVSLFMHIVFVKVMAKRAKAQMDKDKSPQMPDRDRGAGVSLQSHDI